MRRCRVAFWMSIAVSCLAAAPPGLAATPQEVEAAIGKAKQYLYSQQKDGNWEKVATRKLDAKDWQTEGAQWGGLTAIATYALLASGESPQDPRIKQAVEFLKQADVVGTYALGMRANVWPLMRGDPQAKAASQRDAQLLIDRMKVSGDARGMFNYIQDGGGERYDHSCSNYGVLGLWACAEMNPEMRTDFWQVIEEAWCAHQYDDGGWSYIFKQGDSKDGKATPSMTSAGVATLFITLDMLRATQGLECSGNIFNPRIEKGIEWLVKNWNQIGGNRELYTWYNIERIGVASGYKYLGTINWYQEGAAKLVKRQGANGAWGDVPDTCFALLFLSRGRAPVILNKLQYDIDANQDRLKPGHWNQRPRDAASFTKWMSRQTERPLNWQIVNLKAPVEELADAPILYIAGNQDLNFTAEEQDKLRLFVEQGGMILGNADCASRSFVTSFRKLGARLFPGYEFRELPAEHVIYTEQPYPRKNWKTPPSILSLGNGARELMILIPQADAGRAWTMQTHRTQQDLFQATANIVHYAVERHNLRYKGETHVVARAATSAPARAIKLARLKYGGAWDPEPGGWRRLANIMHNSGLANLAVETVELGAGRLDNTFAAAHLTGAFQFRLTDVQRGELRKYMEGGGTLVIDAAGGSSAFGASAEVELAAILPNGRLANLPPEHAVYAWPNAIKEVEYRRYARRVVGSNKAPRLRGIDIGDRTAVVLSREDLSVGLVGQSVDGIIGYEPRSAAELMTNVILYAAGGVAKAQTTQPVQGGGDKVK